jgi:hypothetical protein
VNVQLEKVAIQIKDCIESLAFSGLNFVSDDNIKKIEFFLHNASHLEAYRLATSLRYLHIELKRFLKNRSIFNIERYVFFLSNCWLLSRAFVSEKTFREKKPEIFANLMGTQLNSKIRSKFILRVVGIEKIHLEGTIVGFVFYFLSLFGKTRNKILKWNLMLPYKTGVTPESLLLHDLPNSDPSSVVNAILSKYIEADNLPYVEKEDIIYLEKNPKSKIYIDEESSEDTYVSIKKLDKYYLNAKEIYQKNFKNYEVTPFDLPASILDYLYVKDVHVIDFHKEGIEGDRTPTFVFELTHKEVYPLVIRIPDKQGNLKLIEEFKKLKGRRTPIDGIFCKLIPENGQLSLYPLSIINNNQIAYPNLKITARDNRALLKSMYKIK